jgi:hypothetical protein
VESRSERSWLAVPVGEQDHVRGPASAEVTLVEYGDFECPYTRRARPVARRLGQEFGDRLLFVFRNFPLIGYTRTPKPPPKRRRPLRRRVATGRCTTSSSTTSGT